MEAIEFGTGRSGRPGGAPRLEACGWHRGFDLPADELLLRGEKAALGDEEAVGCNREAGMMMKAAPAAACVMAEADLLLEFLVVALDQPARLGDVDQVLERGVGGRLESQYLAGSLAPFGHSISSHSSGQGSRRFWSRCAGRTRRAAKREVSAVLLPSRQVVRRQARAGRPSASFFAETGSCPGARRTRVGGRPRPP